MELKGITVIDERMETIGQVLRDLAAYPEWMHMCKSSSLVAKVDDNNMTVHIVMKFPVVSDRDLVVRAETFYDLSKARGIVNLSLVTDSPVPVLAGAVRMPEFSGTFVFEYLSREKTGVVYTYRADPGGGVPLFAANIVGKSMIYSTLSNLRNIAKNRKYFEAGQQSTDRQLFENILSDNQKVRAILKARISEYCRDEEWIDAAVADDAIFDYFIKGDGKMAQQLFASWGSRATLVKVVRTMLAIQARKYALDSRTTEAIGNDTTLVSAIIDGKKNGRPFAMDILKSHMLQKE